MSSLQSPSSTVLSSQLALFRKQSKLTDWSLRLPSGKILPVHSLVLSASSPVFDVALNGPYSESKEKILAVDFEDATAELGVALLYGDKVQPPNSVDGLLTLLQFANYYAAPHIVQTMDADLARFPYRQANSALFALQILPHLVPLNAPSTVGQCVREMARDFVRLVVMPDSCQGMLALPFAALELLLQSDLLAAPESLVLWYATEWCEKNRAAGAEAHSRAVAHVRLGLLSEEELKKLVKGHKHISKTAYQRAMDYATRKNYRTELLVGGTVQTDRRADFEHVHVVRVGPPKSGRGEIVLCPKGKGEWDDCENVNVRQSRVPGTSLEEERFEDISLRTSDGKDVPLTFYIAVQGECDNGYETVSIFVQPDVMNIRVHAKVEVFNFKTGAYVMQEQNKLIQHEYGADAIFCDSSVWPCSECVHPSAFLFIRFDVSEVAA